MDSRRIVEQIRFFLQSNDQTDTESMGETLREVNTAYSLCCAEANDRLRRVRDFLQRSLRSEAIHVAEEDPPLLELVALLDFPERPDWENICQLYALGPLPPILMEVAAELSDAYAAEQPLQELLKRHRRLALERAPLKDRLAVLRQIASIDGESDFWPDDVHEYEEYRHRELDDDFRRLKAAKDVPGLKSLLEELKSPLWLTPPSAELVRRIQATLKDGEKEDAARRLRQLAPQLVAACQGANVMEGRRLRAQFDQLAAESGVPGNDPIYDLVQPSMEWLTQVDLQEQSYRKFQDATRRFEQELAEPGDVDEHLLTRQLNDLHSFGFPLPEGLEQRVQLKLAAQRGAAKRQKTLTMIGGAAVIAVLVGLIGVFVVAQMRASSLKAELAKIEARLNDRDYETAGEQIESLRESRPAVTSDTRFMDLEARYRKERDSDAERAARFKAMLAKLKADLEADKKPTEPELKELDSLAVTPSEKAEALSFRGEVGRSDDASRKAKLAQFREKLQSVEKQVDVAESQLNEKKLEEASKSRNEAASEMDFLKTSSTTMPATLVESLSSVEKRLKGISDRIDELDKKSKAGQLFDTVGTSLIANPTTANVDAFKTRLDEAAGSESDANRAKDFRKAAGETSQWKTVLEFNELMRKAKDFSQLSSPSARNRVQDCQKFIDANPRFAETPTIDSFRRLAEALAERDRNSTTSARAKLKQFLNDPAHADVLMLERKIGGRFYTKTPPKFGTAAANILVLTDFGGLTKVKSINPTEVVTTVATPAPQSDAVKEALKILDDASESEWDNTIIRILQLLEGRKAIDPLLRLRMISQVMAHGSAGSVALASALGPWRQEISNSGISLTARWMDPEDTRANTQRKAAEEFLKDSKKFPPFSGVDPELKKATAQLKEKFNLRYDIAGWLLKSESGEWRCVSPQGRLAGLKKAKLFVLSISPGSTASLFRDVGSLSDGMASIRQEAGDSSLVEGRLVFAVVEK